MPYITENHPLNSKQSIAIFGGEDLDSLCAEHAIKLWEKFLKDNKEEASNDNSSIDAQGIVSYLINIQNGERRKEALFIKTPLQETSIVYSLLSSERISTWVGYKNIFTDCPAEVAQEIHAIHAPKPYVLKHYELTREEEATALRNVDLNNASSKEIMAKLNPLIKSKENRNSSPSRNAIVTLVGLEIKESFKPEFLVLSTTTKKHVIIDYIGNESLPRSTKKIKDAFENILKMCPEQLIIEISDLHTAFSLTSNEDGDLALHTAVRLGKSIFARHFLVKNPELKDQQNNFSKTALHIAAQEGNEKLTRILVAGECDVTIKDFQSNTALTIGLRKPRFTKGIESIVSSKKYDFSITMDETNNPIHLITSKSTDFNYSYYALTVIPYVSYKFWNDTVLMELISDNLKISSLTLKGRLYSIPTLQKLDAKDLNEILKIICNQIPVNEETVEVIVDVAAHYLKLGANLGNPTERQSFIDKLSTPKGNKFAADKKDKLKKLFEESPFLAISERKAVLKRKHESSPEIRAITAFFDDMKVAVSKPNIIESEIEKSVAVENAIISISKLPSSSNPVVNFLMTHPVIKELNSIKQTIQLTAIAASSVIYDKNSNQLTLYFPGLDDFAFNDVFESVYYRLIVYTSNENLLTDQIHIKKLGGLLKGSHGIVIRILPTQQKWQNILQQLELHNFITPEWHGKVKISIEDAKESTNQDIKGSKLRELVAKDAIDWQQADSLSKLLDTFPISEINMELDDSYHTLLHIAAMKNAADTAPELLRRGASITATSRSGNNVILTALLHESYDFLQKFLDECLKTPENYQLCRTMWHQEKTTSKMSPYSLALKRFKRGDRLALDLCIKFTGELPPEFIQDSAMQTQLYSAYIKKKLSISEMKDLIQRYVKDLAVDKGNYVKKNNKNKSKKDNKELAADKGRYIKMANAIKSEIIVLAYEHCFKATHYEEHLRPIFNSSKPRLTAKAILAKISTNPKIKSLNFETALAELSTHYPLGISQVFYSPNIGVFIEAGRHCLDESKLLIKSFLTNDKLNFDANFDTGIAKLLFNLCKEATNITNTNKNIDAINAVKELIDFFVLFGATLDGNQVKSISSKFVSNLLKTPTYEFHSYFKKLDASLRYIDGQKTSQSSWVDIDLKLKIDDADCELYNAFVPLVRAKMKKAITLKEDKLQIIDHILSVIQLLHNNSKPLDGMVRNSNREVAQRFIQFLKSSLSIGSAKSVVWYEDQKDNSLSLKLELDHQIFTKYQEILIREIIAIDNSNVTRGEFESRYGNNGPVEIQISVLKEKVTDTVKIKSSYYSKIQCLQQCGILTSEKATSLMTELESKLEVNSNSNPLPSQPEPLQDDSVPTKGLN